MFFQVRERDINPSNIASLFKMLQFFNESKTMVLTILIKKLQLMYPTLSGVQMADILDVFHQDFLSLNSSEDVKNIASQWMEKYSDKANDKDLLEILESLRNLNHVDETIVQALEKMLTVKGKIIKNPVLVSAIMKYCMKVRAESSIILDFGADYFISQV